MPLSSDLRGDGIRVITMEHPPVNALTVQGWFDVAAALDEASRDPDTHVVVLRAEGRGFNAGVDIKEMQNTTGFDALIGANKGCYAAFRAVYECSVPVIAAVHGSLPRRRRRPGRQRRLRGRQRGCLLRSAGGRPRRARSRHPPGPSRAAAPDAHPLLHRPHHRRRRPGPARLRPRGGPPRPPRRRRPRGGRRDREEGHPGDPGRQGGAQRHRPGRREQELPVRAGLHVRAEPVRGRATSCATSSQGRRRANGEQGTTRQADDDRPGGRRAARRDDDRDRRLGPAPQADGAGAGDPALRPEGPHPGQLGRRRRRPAGPGRQGPQAGLRVRLPRHHPARAQLPARPPGRHHPGGGRAGRGHVPDRPSRRGPAAALPADAGRARLRRPGEQPDDQDRHQPVRRSRRQPRGAGRGPGAEPRRRAGPPEPRRPARQRDVPRAGPVLRRPVLHGRRARVRHLRADRRHRRAHRRHPGPAPAAQPDDGRAASSRPRTAPTSPPAPPTTSGTRSSRRRTPPRPPTTTPGRPSRSASCPATRTRTSQPSAPSTRRSDERRHARRLLRRRDRGRASRTTARSSPARWGCCRCSASAWHG